MVLHALAAAEELSEEGVSCEVIDPRTLWPLDKDVIIDSVEKTQHCVVVTEAPAEGGWSGEAAAVVQENCFDALKKPIKRVCGMRTGVPYGKIVKGGCAKREVDCRRGACSPCMIRPGPKMQDTETL